VNPKHKEECNAGSISYSCKWWTFARAIAER